MPTIAERAVQIFSKQNEAREAANRLPSPRNPYGERLVGYAVGPEDLKKYGSVQEAVEAKKGNYERRVVELSKKRNLSPSQVYEDMQSVEAAKAVLIGNQLSWVVEDRKASDYQRQLSILKGQLQTSRTGRPSYYEGSEDLKKAASQPAKPGWRTIKQGSKSFTYYDPNVPIPMPIEGGFTISRRNRAGGTMVTTFKTAQQPTPSDYMASSGDLAAKENLFFTAANKLHPEERNATISDYTAFKASIGNVSADTSLNITEPTPGFMEWSRQAAEYQRYEDAIGPIRPDKMLQQIEEPLYRFYETKQNNTRYYDTLKAFGQPIMTFDVTGWGKQRPKSSAQLITEAYPGNKTRWSIKSPSQALGDYLSVQTEDLNIKASREQKVQIAELGISFASSMIVSPIAAGSMGGKALGKAAKDWGFGFGLVSPAAEKITYSATGDKQLSGYAGLVAGGAFIGVTDILPQKMYLPALRDVKTQAGQRVWTGLSLEKGENAVPLIGKTPKGMRFGTPKDLDINPKGFKDFALTGATETKILTSNVKYQPAEKEGFNMMFEDMQSAKFIYSKFDSPMPLETKSLSEYGTQKTIDLVKQQKAIGYGSFFDKTQFPKLEMAKKLDIGFRESADQDVQLGAKGKSAEKIAAQHVKDIFKGGKDMVRISEESPLLIESKVKGEWHHAVDIHSYDMGEAAPEKALGFEFARPTMKRSGLNVMALPESTIRKGTASLMLQAEGYGPKSYRAKDVWDYIDRRKVQLESQKLRGFDVGKDTLRIQKIGEWWTNKGYPRPIDAGKDVLGVFVRPSSKSMSAFSLPSMGFGKSPSMSSKSMSMGFSASLSPSMSRSMSASVSRSASRSMSKSMSASFSPSTSRSMSLSPSWSSSKSASRSVSRSISRSTSRSASRSASQSRSMSRSPYSPSKGPISTGYTSTNTFLFGGPKLKTFGAKDLMSGFRFKERKRIKEATGADYFNAGIVNLMGGRRLKSRQPTIRGLLGFERAKKKKK